MHPSTTASEAPYLSRPFRCVFPPATVAAQVRAFLLAAGMDLLPAERHPSRRDAIVLGPDADLDLVASLLRDFEGWPY